MKHEYVIAPDNLQEIADRLRDMLVGRRFTIVSAYMNPRNRHGHGWADMEWEVMPSQEMPEPDWTDGSKEHFKYDGDTIRFMTGRNLYSFRIDDPNDKAGARHGGKNATFVFDDNEDKVTIFDVAGAGTLCKWQFVLEKRHDAVPLLRRLTDWGREHTSPLDKNSPHPILVEAVTLLDRLRN